MEQPIPERAWIEIDDAEWEKATPEERRHILRGAWDKGRYERFRDEWKARYTGPGPPQRPLRPSIELKTDSYFWQVIAAIAAGITLLVVFL